MHGGWTRREPRWRAWIVVLAIALIGVTSASAVWHGSHDAGEDCAVCQLRQDTAADLVAAPRSAPADAPVRIASPSTARWNASQHDSPVPARAPPC